MAESAALRVSPLRLGKGGMRLGSVPLRLGNDFLPLGMVPLPLGNDFLRLGIHPLRREMSEMRLEGETAEKRASGAKNGHSGGEYQKAGAAVTVTVQFFLGGIPAGKKWVSKNENPGFIFLTPIFLPACLPPRICQCRCWRNHFRLSIKVGL